MGNPQEANMSAPPAYAPAPAFNSTQGGAPALGVTTYSPLASGLTSGLGASSTQPTVSQSQSQLQSQSQSQSQPLIPQDTPGSGPNSPQQPSFFQPTNNMGTLGGGGVQQAPQNTITTPSPTFQPNHGTVNGTINGQQQMQQGQYQPQGTDFNPYYPPVQGQPSPPPPMYSAPGQPIQFQVVSPLHVLGPGPGAVQCPNCGTRGITNIRHESGSTTHLWAVVACAFICLPCIPYLVNDTKDVRHTCSNCGTLLATYKRSGGTIVHAFGRL